MALDNHLLDTWARNDATIGVWCSMASSFAAEVSASQGFDYACVDLQHGPVDVAAMVQMVQAIRLHDVTPIVRVSWSEPWMIMQVLDAGALGVIIPMIDTAEQAAQAVAACRYPPRGTRSFGPTRAAIAHGTADPEDLSTVACIPMIETVQGFQNLESIAATPGVDALYVGPGDLALSLGLPPRFDGEIPEHEAAIEKVRDACQRHGIAAGIHCPNGREANKRLRQGFQMVTVGNDSALLRAAVADELATARGADDPVEPASGY